MKNTNLVFTLLAFGSLLISCSVEPETIIETITVTNTVTVTTTVSSPTPDTEVVGTGGITFIDDTQTWTNDRIWIMNGKVVVREGGVLNIEEGTIIKAQNGQGDQKESFYDYYGEEQRTFSLFKIGRTFSLGYSITF